MDEQNKSQTPVDPPPDASTAAPSASGQVSTPDVSTTPPSTPESPAVSETAPSTSTPPPAPSQSSISSYSAHSAPPAQLQHKTGKRFSWIIIFLVLLFLGFLALVMWYFSTQLKKTAAPVVQ